VPPPKSSPTNQGQSGMRHARATSRSDRWIVGVCLVASAVMVLTGAPSDEVAEHSDGEPRPASVEPAARAAR
jgi:hypothetical protein